jgi:hypothetical protein
MNLKYIVLAAMALAACTKQGPPAASGCKVAPVPAIGGTVELYPVETYPDYNAVSAPQLKLRFQTAEIFGCSNYSLATNTCVTGDECVVRIDSITHPRVCLTSLGPASAYILLPENVRMLKLMNGNATDTYEIATTVEKISVNKVSATFSDIRYPETNRFLANTFGFVCGTNTNNTGFCDNFAQILADSAAVTEFQYPAGRKPFPDSSSGHWRNHATRFFRYTSLAQFERAGILLLNFTKKNLRNGDGASLSLISWDNRLYASWLMD